MRKPLLTLGAVLLSAAPAHAMLHGTPVVDVEHSGLVSLQTSFATCGAAVLGPDVLLGPARCFDAASVQHPELIGWFMGSQDSDGNPVREVAIDRTGTFALIRLSRPLVGSPQLGLYHGQPQDVSSVRCYSFGPRDYDIFPTGATLSWADYTMSGPPAALVLAGPTLTPFDIGGVCVTRDGSNELAAIITSSSEIVSATLARAFVTEARTTFELVNQSSGLCVGNVPNSGNVWQWPCAPGGNSARLNQQWLLRRVGRDGRFQIRSTRFPDSCLASAGTAEGTAAVVAPCAPIITDPFPRNLPTEYRPEQLWDVSVAAGDAVRIFNTVSSKCLDFGSNVLGAGLVQNTCSPTSLSQRFFVDADRFPAGTHRLAAFADAGQCMDVSFAATWWGAAIGGWYCDGADKQRFDLTSVDGTPSQFVQRAWLGNVTCLAVPGGVTTPGTGVIQWPCGPWLDHHWLFRWTPGLYGFRVHPDHDRSLCLTRPPLAPSAQLVQGTCEAGLPSPAYDAQRWVVE